MKKKYNLKLAVLTFLLFPAGMSFGQTFTFTNCGATGQNGPNTVQVDAEYLGTSLDGAVTQIGGLQYWTVPSNGDYSIEVFGAEGGDLGGLGAKMYGEFSLTAGQELQILVGQMGGTVDNIHGSGGGGSFVVLTAGMTPLIIAGGGGGHGASAPGIDATTAGSVLNAGQTPPGGAPGGTNGGGGAAASGATGGTATTPGADAGGSTWASGGGGFLTNGGGANSGTTPGGRAYVIGGQGGDAASGANTPGGFGGGGGAGDRGAGGGGYSGGGAGTNNGDGGGGGGSYNSGINQNNLNGVQYGHGLVVITLLCNPLTTSVSATDLCEGEMVTLSAVSTGAGTVSWDNGVVDNVPFSQAVGTVTYTATSTDLNDCEFVVDITVNLMPTVDAGVDIILCDGIVDTMLTATGGADTFIWDNGVTNGVQFTPNMGSTIYVVTAEYAGANCQATDTLELIAGSPSVSLYATDEMLGNDGSASLVINSGMPPFTFDWDNDGVGDNDDSNDLYNVPAGTYTVIMTDASGCSTTETIVIGSQVGLDEFFVDLNVYPNPSTGNLTIEYPGSFEYFVFNGIGQNLMNGESVDKTMINLSDFENGTYTIKVISQNESAVVRIVKQ